MNYCLHKGSPAAILDVRNAPKMVAVLPLEWWRLSQKPIGIGSDHMITYNEFCFNIVM